MENMVQLSFQLLTFHNDRLLSRYERDSSIEKKIAIKYEYNQESFHFCLENGSQYLKNASQFGISTMHKYHNCFFIEKKIQ